MTRHKRLCGSKGVNEQRKNLHHFEKFRQFLHAHHWECNFVGGLWTKKEVVRDQTVTVLGGSWEGPLENLWGAGEVQKKYSRRGKLKEKNSCTPINPKKYSCYDLKKIHTSNLITKKNSCGSKIPLPPPPITFLMVRPLASLAHEDALRGSSRVPS